MRNHNRRMRRLELLGRVFDIGVLHDDSVPSFRGQKRTARDRRRARDLARLRHRRRLVSLVESAIGSTLIGALLRAWIGPLPMLHSLSGAAEQLLGAEVQP